MTRLTNMHWTYGCPRAILRVESKGATEEMQLDTLVTWAVIMVGAMVQGLTGVGFALVSVPILVTYQDAKSVIVTTLILSSVLNALILFQARAQISLRDAAPMTFGSLLGVPFGSYLLTVISPSYLKELVALLVLLLAVPLLLGYTSRIRRHQRAASIITGAVSGALQSSTSMGSPPVVLFMANQGIPKEAFRATLVLRSMAASVLSVVALVPSGLIDPALATHALLLTPAMLLGFIVGSHLLRRVPQRIFKKLTILVVVAAALASLASTLL